MVRRRPTWRDRIFEPASLPASPFPPASPERPITLAQMAATVAPCATDSRYHLLSCGHKIHTTTTLSCGTNCKHPATEAEFFCARCFTEPLEESMSADLVSARLARAIADDCGPYKKRECEAVPDREEVVDLLADMFGKDYDEAVKEEEAKEEKKERKRPGGKPVTPSMRESTVKGEEKEGKERKRPGRGSAVMLKRRDRSASPVGESSRRRRSRSPLPRRAENE
ncbi:uncharacterized protein BDZ99DRAFT_471822 [Mytilinidion resinicola]|uniref:Uncharacterized protein n=1 Tax=Mytilinidion resinicola TaxID=574789 RepID=A0A6A6Z7E7_9PEZI|nr:uncharacterized protein BDZ99DRAFT_471822 [Mytilinidion resinicola]KAF2816603.1 hypothetical protein BDZ99DRAFT_471822 [Mytilinidion resinicola]